MLGLVRRLARLRGPAGVLALAVGFGAFTGMVAAHLVLAGWTYRDASRRDLREPGRWALAVLVGGVFVFVPYLLLQRAVDWSGDSGALDAARRAAGRGEPAPDVGVGEDGADAERPASGESTDDATATDDGAAVDTGAADVGPAVGDVAANGRGGSLAATSVRLGWKAARLGGRGARWAAGRAYRQLAD